jgi:hypothetical protein
MAMTVFVPVPMSLAPMLRFALPSAKSLTTTVAGGPPPPAIHTAPAIPTPRRHGPSPGGRLRAAAQPNSRAPRSRHSRNPLLV